MAAYFACQACSFTQTTIRAFYKLMRIIKQIRDAKTKGVLHPTFIDNEKF